MKYVRTTLLLALLLGISLAAYDVKKPMTKEEISEMEQPSKVTPFTVKMERPTIKTNAVLPVKSRAPLSEGFEGGVIPGYFTVVDNDGDGNEWYAYYSPTYAYTGDYSAAVLYNSSGNDDWLITPPLIVATNDSFTFWACSHSSSFLEDFNVKLSTTTNDIDSFTVTLGSVTSTPDVYTYYAYDLSTYIDDTVYCAIQCVSVDEFLLHVDDVSGPEWLDISGPTIAEIQYPVGHWYTGLDDSVIAVITDPNSVDSAFLYYYVTAWNMLAMNAIGIDSFAAAIPAQSSGTRVYWYIEAFDGIGNRSTDPSTGSYVYGIYPSSENLIVYEASYAADEAQKLADAFDNLGYTYDFMSRDEAYDHIGSVASLWEGLWWICTGSASTNSQSVIDSFITYPAGTDSADRHTLFMSGDDIAYSSTSRDFIERIFRCDYIADDLSSSDNIDTVVGIPGNPITDGMPSYTFSSSYPDFVVPTAWATGDPIDEIDASSAFQLIADGDGGAWGDTTPGGLAYSGLTWIGAYIPYEMDEFEDDAARDTLIRRLMESIPTIPMPPFVDACILETDYSFGLAGDLSTVITGYAYEVGGSSGYFTAQVGRGPMGSPLPDSLSQWLWFDAGLTAFSNDTAYFAGQIDIPGTDSGNYNIAYRYSYDKGPWIYADLDGFTKGFDYQYDPAMAGILIVFTGPEEAVKINEIYYDEPGSDLNTYTELLGLPGLSLDSFVIFGVNGSNGAIYQPIDLSGNTIPGDGYFVISQVDIPGVSDFIDPNVNWQNGEDNVVLVYITNAGIDTTIADAVGYGDPFDMGYDTTGWTFVGEGNPAPGVYDGHSLYRGPDGNDTGDNLYNFVGSGILTPGAANFGPPTVVSISDIQGGVSVTPYLDSLLWVTGVITATDGSEQAFIQDATGQWNGVAIDLQYYPFSVGDSVRFVCSPIENSSETRLMDRSMIQIFGTGTIPAPYQTTPGDIDTNEANEGVLVELNLVTVVDTNAGYGEWIVSDGVDSCLVDDYYYSTVPALGTVLSVLRGPVAYHHDDYKIEPRGDWDILSFDVLVTLGFSADTINSSTPVSPWAFIGTNLDAPEDSFYTYFEVDTGTVTMHRDSVYDWIGSGIKQVTFTDWTPGFEGDMTFRYYTALPFDVDPTNDVKEYPIVSSGVGEISDIPTVFNLTVPGISVSMSSIKYAVPERAKVSISLIDRLGRRMVLVDKVHTPGYYEVHMNKMDIPSGVYFIRMESSSFSDQKKMVLVK